MEERLEIIEARMGLHVFRNYSAFCNIWNGCVPVSYVEHEQCNWYLDQLNYNPNVLIPASGNSTIKYAHRPTTNHLSAVRRDRANRNTQLIPISYPKILHVRNIAVRCKTLHWRRGKPFKSQVKNGVFASII